LIAGKGQPARLLS